MSQALPLALRVHEADTVAVALAPLTAGTEVLGVTLRQDLPMGHKLALVAHDPGATVVKFGQPIGKATTAIRPGDHVHVHNLATALSGELTYSPGGKHQSADGPRPSEGPVWQGYRRADGRAATRNEIWIIPTVGCVGITAEEVARAARERHGAAVDGIHAFPHPHGCSQLGDDLSGTRALLAGLAANPNAAGVLLLGLGCESNQLEALIDGLAPGVRDKVRSLSSQSVTDEMAAAGQLVDELVEQAAAARREPMPLADLVVGMKCGGSDGFSGLTANPLLGRFSDCLTAAGGTAILTEIPEIFGAEQPLLDRAESKDVFDRAAALVNRFKRYFLDQGLPVSENPSPGNLAGGITTLEEKSLGAVQKGGGATLTDVIDYGSRATKSGLTLLEAPGNDAVSSSALAAAGATMILFTTGRGTPLGFPVPTMKVASNHDLAAAKPHWIDFDAMQAFDDGPAEADKAFLDRILAIASGEKCAAERSGQRAIAIWKRGATL